MIGVIAKKIGMTSVYQDNKLVACTVAEISPCVVTQIKTIERDGYEAVQLAYEEKKEKRTTKPLIGHFKAAGTTPKRQVVEFRNFMEKGGALGIKKGATVHAKDIFEEGEFIDVTGISKGKGFSGVVKRHGFSGVGERTHGQHNRERAPGSIGAGSTPSRVFKGMRMAGRSGGKRVKMKNLEVIKILADENIIAIKGSFPGPLKSYIILQK